MIKIIKETLVILGLILLSLFFIGMIGFNYKMQEERVREYEKGKH